MAFTGKATYSAGAGLPEVYEDVADVIGIVSPFETPLLDHLGDARRSATSTVHEWIEDELLPNYDQIDHTVFSPNPTAATNFGVDNEERFRVGDLIRADGSSEVMLVTAVSASTITVTRGYGGTAAEALSNNKKLWIIGNAALEGAEASESRFNNRVRKQNHTQIFEASVEVSGSQLAANTIGVQDELDYQMQERMRELLRDLESTVINGVAPTSNQIGSSTVRRSMDGIIAQLSTNRFEPNSGAIPAGDGGSNDGLNETVLNAALREIWTNSSSSIDTIVVNGAQKRRINSFIGDSRGFAASDTAFRDLVSVYESDFGVCRVVLSRAMPQDSVLLLDSSRLQVVPLTGRSFAFKRLASSGDSERGQVIGEYTLELHNESGHGLISGLATS
ncbi:MAG: DUF5309 family protein [Planctomycetota bacterium]